MWLLWFYFWTKPDGARGHFRFKLWLILTDSNLWVISPIWPIFTKKIAKSWQMVILPVSLFVLTILIKPILNKDLYPSSIPPKTTFWKIGVFTFWPKNLNCGFGQFWNFFQKNLRAFPTPPINMNRFYKAVFKWEKLAFGLFTSTSR